MEEEVKYIDAPKGIRMLPKQMKFFIEFVRLGSPMRAYMKAYRVTNKATASVNAQKLLKKFPQIKEAIYDANGLGEDAVIAVLKDAFKAQRVIVDKFGVEHSSEDHYARLKAVQIREDILHKLTAVRGGNQLNVIVVKDPTKGVFEVIEQNPELEA